MDWQHRDMNDFFLSLLLVAEGLENCDRRSVLLQLPEPSFRGENGEEFEF